MRARQVVFAAAILLGCAAGAAASPLIARPSGAFADANSGIETVRWRHRYYRYWSRRNESVGRGDTKAFDADTPTRSLNSGIPAAGSEIFRLDRPQRRGWVDPPPPR
jgi:hypothetical protein